MGMIAAAVVVAAAVIPIAWRAWWPGPGGLPWWRRSALSGVEDLRVGAMALAAVAVVVAAAGTAVNDAQSDRWEPLRPVEGVVVARVSDHVVVDVASPFGTAGGRLQVDVPGLTASIGGASGSSWVRVAPSPMTSLRCGGDGW